MSNNVPLIVKFKVNFLFQMFFKIQFRKTKFNSKSSLEFKKKNEYQIHHISFAPNLFPLSGGFSPHSIPKKTKNSLKRHHCSVSSNFG